MFDQGLYDPALDAFAEEQRAHTASLMELTAGMADIDTASPSGLQWLRDAMEPGGLFGMQCLDFPETRTIAGPAGPDPDPRASCPTASTACTCTSTAGG